MGLSSVEAAEAAGEGVALTTGTAVADVGALAGSASSLSPPAVASVTPSATAPAMTAPTARNTLRPRNGGRMAGITPRYVAKRRRDWQGRTLRRAVRMSARARQSRG